MASPSVTSAVFQPLLADLAPLTRESPLEVSLLGLSRPSDPRKDGLVPLPTEFDPDQAEILMEVDNNESIQEQDPHDAQGVITGANEALEPTEKISEGGSLPAALESRVAELSNEQQTAMNTPETIEEVEDNQERDLALMDIIQSLHASREEYQDEKEEPVETALSSPLSEVPDLPSELPPSPDPPSPPPAPPSPPSPKKKAVLPFSQALPAESSSAAQKSRSPAPTQPVKISSSKRSCEIVEDETSTEDEITVAISGEATRKSLNRSSREEDVVEGFQPHRGANAIESKRDDDTGSESEGQERLKKQKGTNGRPVRAKSRKLLDQVLGIGRYGEAASEKLPLKARVLTDAQLKQHLVGKTTEVQAAPCLRPRYAKWGKCTQCVSKVGRDTCRFRDYRVFKIDPNTTEILGPGWFESTEWKEAMTKLPRDFNVPLNENHIRRIEQTVAPLLLPLITRELRHVVKNKAIKRGVDAAVHRAVCDFCSSTIFGGWFFCRKCGRDYCLVCERYFADSFEKMGESPWHLPDAARPRLLRCVLPAELPKQEPKPASRSPAFHFRTDLQPVSRFSVDHLTDHWLSLAEFVLSSEGSVGERLKLLGLGSATEKIVGQMQDWVAALPSPPPVADLPLTDEDVKRLYTKSTHASAPVADPAELEAKSMEFMFIDNTQLTLEVFDQLWGKGEPIVVDHVGGKLKMSWTPDDFVERFGNEQCFLVDCQTNTSEVKTVRYFFELFKDRENRSQRILKLKDWPETEDFANTHPDLYNDFCNALPVPDFTRREGVLNLYAHFPPGPTRPDIGPKMYNAFEAKETSGGHGSTRLHMDVADAVNVMLYASPRNDGTPGCAVWDLFRAEDADKIRLYLKKKFDKTHKFTDPIHSQLFYLDSRLRKELSEKYGVVSWRVYQYPGQAVFIPAGCAHQVCNLADCIKIALDFVSTHNVSRCQQLTQDFRTENFVKAWKDDVLQLYNVLWYAWTNVRETRERRIEEDKVREEEARVRAARLASLQNGEHERSTSASPFASRLGIRHGGISSTVSSIRDEDRDESSRYPSRPPSPSILAAADNVENAEEGETLTPSRSFSERLLDAALSASEPPPPPEARAPSSATKWGGKISLKAVPKKEEKPRLDRLGLGRSGVERSSQAESSAGTPKRMTTSQLIKSGVLPIDLAVSAARLQMGEGADEGEMELGERGGEEAALEREGAAASEDQQRDAAVLDSEGDDAVASKDPPEDVAVLASGGDHSASQDHHGDAAAPRSEGDHFVARKDQQGDAMAPESEVDHSAAINNQRGDAAVLGSEDGHLPASRDLQEVADDPTTPAVNREPREDETDGDMAIAVDEVGVSSEPMEIPAEGQALTSDPMLEVAEDDTMQTHTDGFDSLHALFPTTTANTVVPPEVGLEGVTDVEMGELVAEAVETVDEDISMA